MNDDRLCGRFLFLDALRGIAAVSVALFHFNNQWFSPTYREFSAGLPAALLAVWHHLDLGVEVFFVLSGFVIAHSLHGHRVTAGFAGNFIVRRSIRLDPPYWLVLFLTMMWPYLVFPTLVVGFFEKFGGWTGLVINMFYLPDLLSRPRIVPVAWTLCLEVQFYLCLITLMFLRDLNPRWSAKTRATVIAVPFALLTAGSIAHWFITGENNFGGRWWTFASGALLYTSVRRQWPAGWMLSGLAAILILSLVRAEPHSIAIVLTALAIFAAASLGKLQTWLAWSPFQYFGRISYSLYLVHIPIGIATIATVQRFGDGTPTSVVTGVVFALLATTLVADALNRTVEGPAARLAHRLHPRRGASSEATVVHSR